MEERKIITRVPVTYKFRLIAKSPVSADFKFDFIKLDIDKINKEGIEELDEVILGYIDTSNSGNDNIFIETILNYNIRSDNKYYLSFINGVDRYRGPLSSEKIILLEKAHKKLLLDLVTYIGWLVGSSFNRNDLKWQNLDFYYSYEVDGIKGDKFLDADTYTVVELFYLTTKEKVNLHGDDFLLFYQLQKKRQAIPLYQELFIEAISLSANYNSSLNEPTSARSAFLMLYTSLEVAVKSLIKKVNPDTEWIIKGTQAPPLVDIMTQYMISTNSHILDKNELESIRSIAMKRNNIAHNGDEVLKVTLDKYTELVRGWLIKIDTELGYGWIYDKPYRH